MLTNTYYIDTENPDNVIEIEDISKTQKTKSNTKDLVRLYLQEIGRVPLLEKDEEVTKAQQVQRYMSLLQVRNQAASDADPVIQLFVKVMSVHEALLSRYPRPSWEKWAKEVDMEVDDLKNTIQVGKRRWASLANLDEVELEKILQIGTKAKQDMINCNLRLVVSVAKKYQHRGLELLDLIQEGTLGLEKAVEKFDPTKGYRFSTYAYWWIRQGITRAIATQSRNIRLPVHITEKLNKIKKAQRALSQRKGRTPTIEDIAAELAMTPAQIREVLMRVPRSVSLDIKVGKEKDTELVDLLENNDDSPEDKLIYESLQKDLGKLLENLTTRERDVIEMRFGLKDGNCYSLADVSRALNLSRERVRQIENKGMQKLRHPKRRHQVKDYLDSLS